MLRRYRAGIAGRLQPPSDREGRLTLHIQLLGGFAVRDGGREVAAGAFGGELARRLLRMLATRRGQLVTRDALVEALWPRDRPADPPANLSALVSRVRRAVGAGELIQTRPGGYVLAGERCVVDAEAVLRAVERARAHAASGNHAAARRDYEEALSRWTGEPLPQDRYADWASAYRRQLEQAHVEALEGAARAALAVGDTMAATRHAERAVAAEPLRETPSVLLIRALAAGGDRAGALAAYELLRRALADELGIDPTPQTAMLHTRLLRGEDLAAVKREPGGAPVRPATRRADRRLTFVGRDAELAAIRDHLRGEPPNVVLVAGQAGAGKSRLLAEAIAPGGAPAIAVRAFLGERDEPWSLTRSLVREALGVRPEAVGAAPESALPLMVDLLPDVAEVPTGLRITVDEGSRRALRLEGCRRLLRATAAGTLLVVDDAQWADATSLQLLRSVVERAVFSAVLIAFRPEETPDDSVTGRFLAELVDVAHPLHLRLAPLDAAAIGDLVADAQLVAVIERDTDRTPFAIAELLRTLAAQAVVHVDSAGRWTANGAEMERIARVAAREGYARAIRARVNRQPARHRHLIELLALLVRETPATLLADAAGEPASATLEILADLSRADLARSGEAGWAVHHDLIGETVRDQIGAADRMRRHAAIAAALTRAGADIAGIAWHRAQAGDPAAAIDYATAARDRLERHAVAEAHRLVQDGLGLASSTATTATLLEVRAEVRFRQGDLSGGRQDLRVSLRHQDRSSDRARVLTRMAMAALGADDPAHAGELAELALVEAGAVPASRARALAVAAVVGMNTGEPERAERRATEALELFQQLGDAAGVADILDGRAMATFLDGRITEALGAFDRVARLFTDAGDLLRVVTPRSTRGHGLVFAGQPAEALADVDAALQLAEDLGDLEGQSYALWHRAEALAALDRVGEAIADANRALHIARRLEHRGWTATALRAVGIAHAAAGELAAAEQAFRDSLDAAANVPLFTSWAASRLALTRLARGDAEDAERFVQQALAQGPALSQFEARFAHVEVAAARADPAAPQLARTALEFAERAGYLAGTPRLRRIAGRPSRVSGV